MSFLDTLKQKWFLQFSSTSRAFPPQARYPGCTVSDHTDCNIVTPLIDGQNYMKKWYKLVQTLTSNQCYLYHTGLKMDGVNTLGGADETSDAVRVLAKAAAAQAHIQIMLSGHGNEDMPDWLRLKVWDNKVVYNQLRAAGIKGASADFRFPIPFGTNHQKAAWFRTPAGMHALVGSVDIFAKRWDTSAHAVVDPLRAQTNGSPTHDTGVWIQGPAVRDIERSFIDRWNDPSRSHDPGLVPGDQPLLTVSTSPLPANGTHSVQVLHTFGRTERLFGYDWYDQGSFTIWAAYLNAIKKATSYIYIEDQYFLPFGWPVARHAVGNQRDSDIIYQLGEAIKRGVRVMVLTPSFSEDSAGTYQIAQRDVGVRYLQSIRPNNQGDFIVVTLAQGTTPVYIHSKLLICDDEYVLIGSANVNQRSMTHDGELSLGIVDEDGLFAKNFRKTVWAEHLGVTPAAVDNPIDGYHEFWKATQQPGGNGRLRPYKLGIDLEAPAQMGYLKRVDHSTRINKIIDPYGGPAGYS